MTDIATPADEPQSILKPKQPIGVLTLVIAAAFGLFFAYYVYQAIGNLLELPKSYEAFGIGDQVPWVLLIIGLLIPVILYVVSFALALRRRALDKVIIFTMGLVTSAAFSYGIVAMHRVTLYALDTAS